MFDLKAKTEKPKRTQLIVCISYTYISVALIPTEKWGVNNR